MIINKSGYHLFDNRFNKWHPQGISFGFAQDKFTPVVPHAMRDFRVLSASVRWTKKLFKASSQRQGGRVSGVHPAVQDRSKISWV